MKIISIKDIVSQLQKDLIGKDSHRGVTLTYSWLANQFGHFSLGFVPTVVVFYLLTKVYNVPNAMYWSSLGVSGAWLLFEIYNFLKPLLTKPSKKDSAEERPFKPKWLNVAYDTFTDLCFFWVGAFSAHLLLDFDMYILYALILLLIILSYSSFYWFTVKMYQQAAKFPIQFRLSQWEKKISKENIEAINSFLASDVNKQHMLLFGARKSGKTSLAVGLANENSINRNPSTYTTAMKVFGLFSEDGSQFKKEPGRLWGWRKASYLVIDDINPGYPITDDIITEEIFGAIIDSSSFSELNKKALQRQSVIWVAGNKDEKREKEKFQNDWVDFLKEIGVNESNITLVNLQN